MTPKLTASGKNLLLRALAGETINFTKIQLGNGTAQDPIAASALVNPILTLELTKIEVGKEYVTLSTAFTNGSIANGFHITEAGFFATDPDDSTNEILYALGNEDESSADYVPDKGNRILEMQFDALIFIGDAENVTAAIGSSLVYVSKDEFDDHTLNKANPHVVTKAQVGLGNVPNVSTNDQTPTFTEATVLKTIESGEKTSVIFGKIKLAITQFINHLSDRNNPHRCTALQVGAAKKNHTHNAQDIKDGVLPVSRGGTGCSSIAELKKLLGIGDGTGGSETPGTILSGGYHGDGSPWQFISLGHTPNWVTVTPAGTPETEYNSGTAAYGQNSVVVAGYEDPSYADGYALNSYYHYIKIAITTNGFYVCSCADDPHHAHTNDSGQYYNINYEII